MRVLIQNIPVDIDPGDIHHLLAPGWRIMHVRDRAYVVRHVCVNRKKGTILLHREIVPGHEMVDHRDGDSLNNVRSNVRGCTREQNCWNRGPQNGRKYKGVYHDIRRGKKWGKLVWRVTLSANGITYGNNHFATEVEAALAYDALARLHHGEFAYQNFPGGLRNDTAIGEVGARHLHADAGLGVSACDARGSPRALEAAA